MSSEIAVEVKCVGKCFQIYKKPHLRLAQFFLGKRRQLFKEFWALKDVSFTIKKGDALGIVGRNGSGKSTLLQLICGTLFPTTGTINHHGKIAALLELGAGFNREFTGRENVFLCASLYGLSQAEIKKRFAQIASFADIGDYIDQPVKTYSSGMYVRLAFAVIAHIDADILIIDEALSVGDAVFAQKCMRFLRDFRQYGTLIFVSHDSSSIINLCEQAIWLNQGHLMMEGTAKDVTEAYLAFSYEQQQGESHSGFKKKVNLTQAKKEVVVNDSPRVDTPTDLSLLSKFDSSAASFGNGEAQIEDVWLENQAGEYLQYLLGGEQVVLYVRANIKKDISQPIVGFNIKDRLGQSIFGDNTYLTYQATPPFLKEGTVLLAEFCFTMPFLKAGTYSIETSVADGTQEIHQQLHWIHDAIIFEFNPNIKRQRFIGGLIGVPMERVELKIL